MILRFSFSLILAVLTFDESQGQSLSRLERINEEDEIINLPIQFSGSCPENLVYVTVLADQFNQDSLDRWFWVPNQQSFNHSPVAHNTDEFYQEANLEFNSLEGVMKMVAKIESIDSSFIPWLPENFTDATGFINAHKFTYTSGAITSRWSFLQGMYEINAKMPSGFDFWPAFWLFSHCADEIDILEFMKHGLGSREGIDDLRWEREDIKRCESISDSDVKNANRLISHSVHKKLTPGCEDIGEENIDTKGYTLSFDFSKDFHKIAVKWDDFSIKFYVDNNLIRTFYHYYARVPLIFQNGLLRCLGMGGGNSADRTFTKGPDFFLGIENCTEMERIWIYDQNENKVRYFQDPQFSVNMTEIIIQNAVYKRICDPKGESEFPDALEIDHFKFLDAMECGKTIYLDDSMDFEPFKYNSWVGKRNVTSGRIIVNPGSRNFVIGPGPWEGHQGDLGVLTASEEIIFIPPVNPDNEFAVLPGGNLIAQILPCESELIGDPAVQIFGQTAIDSTSYIIYPNPLINSFQIFSSKLGQTVEVWNLLGQQVHSEMLLTDEGVIELQPLSPGIYLIILKTGQYQVFGGKAAIIQN